MNAGDLSKLGLKGLFGLVGVASILKKDSGILSRAIFYFDNTKIWSFIISIF